MEVIKLRQELVKNGQQDDFFDEISLDSSFSRIRLSQFYGIELDDFAHEVAILSLWLAEHQMNVEFKAEFGDCAPSLPLKASGGIFHGNALKLDWFAACPPLEKEEVYIIGNPPYIGSKNQSKEQKEDMKQCLKELTNTKALDYIACWFIKAAQVINSKSAFAFVTTNSVCQGTQVPLLWKIIFNYNVEIFFAYKDFKWRNNAKNNAGVTVSILGLRKESKTSVKKFIFENEIRREVTNINPYLIDSDNILIDKAVTSICDLPKMQVGNEPYDGGNLIFTDNEKQQFIVGSPTSEKYFKKLVGSNELLKGTYRWCLWIEDDELEEAKNIPEVNAVIDAVRISRESGGMNARSCAHRPHQFRWVNRSKTNQIVIPLVSSERRPYIPISFIDKETIITNLGQVIYDAPIYIFSIISSHIHMTWVRAITGRLESRIRYSSGISYNTFPVPNISSGKLAQLEIAALNIIEARESYSELNLGDMYDPKKMPDEVRKAHEENDKLVDSLYSSKGFSNDTERLECLFSQYEPPRLYRRVDCLSQAALSDSQRLS